ncbi:autotransporter domain-containing protein [Aliarcobacter cryaerophilus]|uniref:autotransporter family protein n=1 Tax=Aliarcobacter cryaerophilus TaxID=28198 RepID=UPI0021B3328E|nr:autotransporter outer membrane beta-barrel domain-containing protein [Aliarcobacter cryaerophilus]MCT7431918.1 autotransporter domain-containing protein [Aliarcobacter cryaerophilus]
MKIDYSRKSKVSFLLSTMLLGAVSLSASNENYIQELNLVSGNSYTNSNSISQATNAYVLTAGIKLSNLPDTSSNSPTSLTNNAKIDLKSTGGEEVAQIGVLSGDYNYNEDDLPSTQVNFLEFTNNSDITVSTNSNSHADSVGIFSYNIQGNSKLINNKNIDVFAKSNEDETNAAGVVLGDFGGEIKNSKNASIKAVSEGNKLSTAFGISAVSSENGSLVNEGSINVSAKAKDVAFGVATEFWGWYENDEYSLLDGSFSNSGTIKASAQSDKYAVASGLSTDALVEDSTIINSGVISSNAVSKDVKKAFAYGLVGSELVNSTITNSGTIEAKVNGKLNNQGFSLDYEDTSGSTITNEKTGKLYGNIYLGGNGQFANKGFVSLPYNANALNTIQYLDDDGNPEDTRKGRVYISNLVNSGTIEIGAFKHSDNKIENTQILTKNATFEKGSKMQVDVVAGSKAFVKGDTLSEVVTATDKLTINDLTLNQTKLADNSATLDFKYEVKDGKRIDLVVSDVKKLSDIVDDKGNGTDTKNIVNKKSIAKTLDEFRNNQAQHPQMGAILSQIDTLSTNKVINAVNSMIPTTATSVVNSSNTITSNISNIVSNRLGNLKGGLNSGDDLRVDNNRLWVKAFGSIGEQRDKDSISGFDLKTYGLGLGYDNEYKDGQIIGLSTFYTNANVETNGVNHKNDVDAYSIVAYGSNLLPDNKTTIYYQGSYTWQKNDSKRSLFTGDRADAKFTSKTFALDLKVGHKIAINDSFSVEPNIGTTYRHISNPSYTENGAGALNIRSDKFTSAEFLGNFGADFEYKITSDSKLTATIGAGYDFKDDDNIVTSSFAGASGVSFDTNGIDNGRWQYQAGIGYDVNLNNQNNLNFSYKYQGEGSKYNNNVVSLDYIYKF